MYYIMEGYGFKVRNKVKQALTVIQCGFIILANVVSLIKRNYK